ncbi:MAG: LamG-like jellyroll fold domain-containing protein [Bacteroidota bacterium]
MIGSKGLIKNNSHCIYLFEVQTGDVVIKGNRARGFVDGMFKPTPPVLDSANKLWGSQSALYSSSNNYCKFYRDINATIVSILANNQFRVNTDLTTYFVPGKKITIKGASNNNGNYIVVSSSYGSYTTVTIAETTLSVVGTFGTVGHINPLTLIGTKDFTAEAVFRTPYSYNYSYQDVFGFDFTSGITLEVVTATPYLWLYVKSEVYTIASPLAFETWFHFLCVRKSGKLKVWLNGVLVISDLSNTENISVNNDFYVGSDGSTSPNYYWGGNIQRVGFWNSAMYWHEGATIGKRHFTDRTLKNIGDISQ